MGYNNFDFILQYVTKCSALFLAILPNMDKQYWRCDPNVPVDGITYLQLTKLLQVFYNKAYVGTRLRLLW